MKIILIGPPGVGKGTQGTLLSSKINIPVISTGQVIRDAIRNESDNSKGLKSIVTRGDLIPDDLMVEILDQRIIKDDCENGYILDGFPRTISQAETLQSRGINIDYVIEFKLNDDDIVERLSGRLYHPGSGRVYHKAFNPPQKPGIDDVSGEALIIRSDDQPESIIKRLQLFKKETSPLIDFYQSQMIEKKLKYVSLDASQSVDQIQDSLLKAIL